MMLVKKKVYYKCSCTVKKQKVRFDIFLVCTKTQLNQCEKNSKHDIINMSYI